MKSKKIKEDEVENFTINAIAEGEMKREAANAAISLVKDEGTTEKERSRMCIVLDERKEKRALHQGGHTLVDANYKERGKHLLHSQYSH